MCQLKVFIVALLALALLLSGMLILFFFCFGVTAHVIDYFKLFNAE